MNSRATARRLAETPTSALPREPAPDARPRAVPRHALRAWPAIARACRAGSVRALLLDFDGTLVPIRRRPQDVRCSRRLRALLARVARRPQLWVGIITGRRARAVARLVGVPGIHYRGAYGAETEDAPLKLPAACLHALSRARRTLAQNIRNLKGVWLENKGLSFVLHYRTARRRAIAAAEAARREALAPAQRFLRAIAGKKTWEVVPRRIPGKGAAVSAVLRSLPPGAVAAYLGDDAADEAAFAALPRGITICVGRREHTCARYFLRGPAEVFEWLARFEEVLD